MSIALDLDFLSSETLDPRVTATGGANGWRVNSSGVMVAASAPRYNHDPITLQRRGVLREVARTNRCLRSNALDTSPWGGGSVTVTTGAANGPDATASMALLDATADGASRSQAITFSGDGTKAVSIWIKAGTAPISQVNLRDDTAATLRGRATINWSGGVPSVVAQVGTLEDVEPWPGGLYRIKLICPSVIAANTNTLYIAPDRDFQGTMYAGWVQAEDGGACSTYIASAASAVTRSADSLQMTDTNFSSWWNASEGTFVWEADTFQPGSNSSVFQADTDGNNGMWSVLHSDQHLRVYNGGVEQCNLDSGSVSANTVTRGAVAFKANDFAAIISGGTLATDTSGSVPSCNKIDLGGNAYGGACGGHLRRFKFDNTRRSNADLPALIEIRSGAAALTEGADTVTATGQVKIKGTAAITEGDDVATGSAEVGVELVTPAGRIARAS